MRLSPFAIVLVVITPIMSACSTDGATSQPVVAAQAGRMMDQSVPPVARSACLAAVSKTTNNSDVQIVEMIYSEANSQITIGVGPTRAAWQCLVSRDGIVANVMSMTDEGAL